MSNEERRLMKYVDDAVLTASPERLEELRRLDIETQLSGMTFYESVVNAGALETAHAPRAKTKK